MFQIRHTSGSPKNLKTIARALKSVCFDLKRLIEGLSHMTNVWDIMDFLGLQDVTVWFVGMGIYSRLPVSFEPIITWHNSSSPIPETSLFGIEHG